jgi:flagellar protein FliO/FliZ
MHQLSVLETWPNYARVAGRTLANAVVATLFVLMPLKLAHGAQEAEARKNAPVPPPVEVVQGVQASSTAKVSTMPDSIPVKRNTDRPSEDDGRAGWALAFLLALGGIGGLAVVWRNRVGSLSHTGERSSPSGRWMFAKWRGNSSVQVRNTTQLTQRHSLHEVQWNGHKLLIGCADKEIRLLINVPLPASETQETNPKTSGTSKDSKFASASSPDTVGS